MFLLFEERLEFKISIFIIDVIVRMWKVEGREEVLFFVFKCEE